MRLTGTRSHLERSENHFASGFEY